MCVFLLVFCLFLFLFFTRKHAVHKSGLEINEPAKYAVLRDKTWKWNEQGKPRWKGPTCFASFLAAAWRTTQSPSPKERKKNNNNNNKNSLRTDMPRQVRTERNRLQVALTCVAKGFMLSYSGQSFWQRIWLSSMRFCFNILPVSPGSCQCVESM